MGSTPGTCVCLFSALEEPGQKKLEPLGQHLGYTENNLSLLHIWVPVLFHGTPRWWYKVTVVRLHGTPPKRRFCFGFPACKTRHAHLYQIRHLYSWYGSNKLVFLQTPSKMNRTNKLKNQKTCQEQRRRDSLGGDASVPTPAPGV